MMKMNASQLIRSVLMCGCVVSAGLFLTSATARADGRGDSDRRSTTGDSDQGAGRGQPVPRDRSSGSSRGIGSPFGSRSRSSDGSAASDGPRQVFGPGSSSKESDGRGSQVPQFLTAPRSSSGNSRSSAVVPDLPWRQSSRLPFSDQSMRGATPRGNEVRQQLARPSDLSLPRSPELRTNSSQLPFRAMAEADQPDRSDRQSRRGSRSDSPRTSDAPRVADTPRTADTPHVQESPTPSNRPTLRSRDDVSRSNPSVTTDQPRTIQRDDTPRRGETSNAPDRSRPVTRTDGNNNSNNASPSTNNRISRDTPVIRNDNQGAKGSNEIDRSITRDREDVARSIARPSTTTDSNRNQPQVGDVSRNGSNSTGQFSRGGPITRSDTTGVRGGANIGTGSGSPVFRSNDNVARSISRPQAGASRINRQPSDVVSRTNTTIDRNDPITMKRTDTSRTTTANDRSLPISRSRDGTTRTAGRTPPGVERPITSNFSRTAPDIARNPRGATQIGAGRDMNVTSNAGTRGFNNSRTIDRSTSFANRGVARDDSVRTASAVRRDGTIRTASFHDSSTVAHAKVGGRDIFIREAHGAHGKDVYVINAGHFRPDHWPHGDYRPHGDGDDWRHGDDWHHGEWHDGEWRHDRHFDFDVSFTFVHSYCAPAGVVYYDVMPVEPVVYASPVYSLSFAYVGHHSSVVISSVRYIEPVAFAPPTMVVYPAVYAAPIVTPVVYSPIVAAPVVAAVPVPVVTPAYAPMYYYYPAYTYYPVYSAVVAPAYVVEQAPAPVVAAPAVVEAPSSSWSIGTAFSFLGHHGKSFSLGGSFTKVNSEPAVVAAPAVVSPAAAVEPVPAGASPAEAVAPTAAAEASAAGTTLDAGLAAIRAGEMDKARSILSQVVISDPDNGMARMLYAAALLADGRYKESAESLRRSLETWSDFELKDFYLPAVYDNPKVFTQVMRDVREFLSDHPERIDAWLLVAWSYAVSGQSNEATMLLTEARKSWPEDSIFGTLDKVVQANERAEQATASAK